MATPGLHRGDPAGRQQPVAGEDGPLIAELLLAVDNARVVQPQLRVGNDLLADPDCQYDREGGNSWDVGVASGARRLLVVVDRIGLAHGLGELAELLAPDLVPEGGVLLAEQGSIQWHGLSLLVNFGLDDRR